MDIDRDAEITASGSVEVSASPDEVWTILSDIGAGRPGTPTSAKLGSIGDLAAGSRFEWRAGPGTISSVLRSVEPSAGARVDRQDDGRARRPRLAA